MRKSLSNGLQAINALRPVVFKQSALKVFGSEARFSLVAGTCEKKTQPSYMVTASSTFVQSLHDWITKVT